MEDRRKSSSWCLWAIAASVLLVFGYPISVGPAIWLCNKGYVPYETVNAYECPLEWVIDHVPEPLAEILKWSYRWASTNSFDHVPSE